MMTHLRHFLVPSFNDQRESEKNAIPKQPKIKRIFLCHFKMPTEKIISCFKSFSAIPFKSDISFLRCMVSRVFGKFLKCLKMLILILVF